MHNFGKDRDGTNPIAGLVAGPDEALYGTTAGGGHFGFGTVFKLRPRGADCCAWTEEILYSFTGGNDGGDPLTAVTIDPADGTIYGTTNSGGVALEGTAFTLVPPSGSGTIWTETVIHSFTEGDDGFHPSALVLGTGKILYGTSHGIRTNYGAVFSLTPPASADGLWNFDALHDFRGSPDGSEPDAALLMGSDGSLYGTTVSGGTDNHGVIFSLTPPASPGGAWKETVVVSLSAGNAPNGLTFGEGGAIYGTTKFGGTLGLGTAFALVLQ